jgi:hypothetical protein
MLPFGMTIPATVPQRSEIPEGLRNYPVNGPKSFGMSKLRESRRINCEYHSSVQDERKFHSQTYRL